MHKEDEHAKCPYYRKDTVQAVHCEGVGEGIGLRLGFQNKTDHKEYKTCFCRDNWKDCMIAKMLNRKYDYEP